jgi:hypothetical protein
MPEKHRHRKHCHKSKKRCHSEQCPSERPLLMVQSSVSSPITLTSGNYLIIGANGTFALVSGVVPTMIPSLPVTVSPITVQSPETLAILSLAVDVAPATTPILANVYSSTNASGPYQVVNHNALSALASFNALDATFNTSLLANNALVFVLWTTGTNSFNFANLGLTFKVVP